MRRKCLGLVLGCLILFGWPTGPRAEESQHHPQHHRFALVLDFSTCTGSYTPADPLICSLFEPNGERAGRITVTPRGDDAPLPGSWPSAGFLHSWHDDWKYTLAGGTLSVGGSTPSTNWEAVFDPNSTPPTGPAGFIGFGKGDVTGATGRFAHATGTITMRWDGVFCICLIDLVL